MITAFIVEDKPPILRGIKKLILEQTKNIAIIGEFHNGMDALKKIIEAKPDLIITDIIMPQMDGIALIKAAKELHRDCSFVIISAYNDFEYARSAVKLGVTDYLLKPITPQDMQETLAKILPVLMRKKADKQTHFLNSLLLPEATEYTDFGLLGSDLCFPVGICIGAPPFAHICDNELITKAQGDIIAAMPSILPFGTQYWNIETSYFNVVLLVFSAKNPESDAPHVINCLIKHILKKNIPFTLIYDLPTKQPNCLSSALGDILHFLYQCHIFGKSKYAQLSEFTAISSSETQNDLFENLNFDIALVNSHGNVNLLKTYISTLIHKTEQQNLPQHLLIPLLNQVVMATLKATNNQSLYLYNYQDIEQIVLSSSTDAELATNFLRYWKMFFLNSEKIGESKSLTLAKHFKVLLDQNITNSVTIENLAENIGHNSSYLGKVFKTVYSISPVEYLSNIRIHKAKELLEQAPPMKIKDIAECLGYSNQYYFSRVFKLTEGISPNTYRQNCSTEEK